MVFFTLEDLCGDEHGEVCVLNAHFFDLFVEPGYVVPGPDKKKKVKAVENGTTNSESPPKLCMTMASGYSSR